MIKVLIPDMPTADELLPYLRAIDKNRWYTNQGPMVRALEAELAPVVGAPCRVVSTGTAALELSLRALDLPAGSGVLLPAVTFRASAQAIANAGLRPIFCDVDSKTWQLSAVEALAFRRLPHAANVRAVMPVATYGAPVPIEPWETFSYETNLPVVIDAAGALLDQRSSVYSEIVVCYSLHATKTIGAGEGGIVATQDQTLLARVEDMATFGVGGTNAKMSEYHAAVGRASLARRFYGGHEVKDGAATGSIFAAYSERLAGCTFQAGWSPNAPCLTVMLPRGYSAAVARDALLDKGIETRQWYRPFPDEFAQFSDDMGRVAGLCPVTTMLRNRGLGLPWHRFMTAADAHTVCDALAHHLK